MNILLIGSGGREHALAWRLAQSPSVTRVFATPGNPGIAQVAECLPASSNDFLKLASATGSDLTVVGPEAPLVAGIADAFRNAGKAIVGPNAAAARLEGSKIFAKRFMQRARIPTARFATAETLPAALAALEDFGAPVVLKADGLASGKGVVVAHSLNEARQAAAAILSGNLVGAAGRNLVIEEFLSGEEVSFIVLSDGRHVVPLEATQDHKAIYDADTGPNTGGMGAYCDHRILTSTERQTVLDRIIQPVIDQMAAEGNLFTGFLYAGLMLTEDGPKVLEFNVRLGDPETQALMHRLDDDFAEVLMAAAQGDLSRHSLRWSPDPSVCVVMSAAGYPARPRTGDPIHGIAEAEANGSVVFHAGTRLGDRGLETAGGRVLGVTASGPTLPTAIQAAYESVRHIHFEGAHYRNDIGRKGLARWQPA